MLKQSRHRARVEPLEVHLVEVRSGLGFTGATLDCDFDALAATAEDRVCSYLEADHLAFAASGLSALQAALYAAGAGPGAEVICDAMFPFGIMATRNVGAHPVLADIDEASLTMDPLALRAALTERTRAVIATATFGVPPNIAALRHEIAARPEITLIEDHAQAFGVRIDGEAAAKRADIACFSFHASKPLSAGCGGAISSRSSDLIMRARRYTELGWYPRKNAAGHTDWEGSWRRRQDGCQSARLPPVAAALLLARLESFPEKRASHISAVQCVVRRLGELHVEVNLQQAPIGYDGQRWRIALLCADAVAARKMTGRLRVNGSRAYSFENPPPPKWPAFSRTYFGKLPIIEDVLPRLIALPVGDLNDASRELSALGVLD